VAARTCSGRKQDGSPCMAPPLREADFRLMHDPEHAEEAAEARRLGGQRRRRERVVCGAYDFEGLGRMGQVRRLVEVAVIDVLGLENSISRARTLGSLAQTAASLLEKGEFEERLSALESVMEPRLKEKRRR
jgi:hypothetical protein